MLDPQEILAQTDDETPASGADPSSPPELQASDSPSEPSVQELRNRLSQSGRETAAERQRREQAEQQVVALSTQLNQMQSRQTQVEQYLAAQQRAEQEAALAALPPEQRALEEVKLLRDQITRAQQTPPPPPVPSQETPAQYQARRTREMIEEANQTWKLGGRLAITGQETALDTSSEQTFAASIRALAIARAEQTQEDPVATANKKPETPAEMEARIRASVKTEVMKELGVGGSNSARPAAIGQTEDPTRADFDKVAYSRRPGDGMVKTREQLRTLRDQAREAAGLSK